MYRPRPVDTADIVLPDDLMDLQEQLAENTHEVWAAQRISLDWKYGSPTDGASKTHSCLVPYCELSDSDKELDRRVAIETLKLIMVLGYKIVKDDRSQNSSV